MDNCSHIIRNRWNEWSETWYAKYRTDEVISKIINDPASAFHPVVYAMIREAFPSLHGKRVFVPSSGDNHAVFALHLMGAQVTSSDISEKQMMHAAKIASQHGWDIEFICEDTMKLSQMKSGEYDFVYTSNGVHVWISDLNAMYSHIYRVLKNDGSYIMFDIHPFMRPLGRDTNKLTVVKPYHRTGPLGEIPVHHWRIQDLMNAVISAGLTIRHIEEMYAEDGTFWVEDSSEEPDTRTKEEFDRLSNWEFNPMAAIPQWLSMCTIK